MSPLVLLAMLTVGAAEPDSNVLAGIELSGGAVQPVYFGVKGSIGLRFGPVRFGAQLRGPFALELGGFFTVDLVRAQLESRLSIALFTGFEVMGRLWGTQWSAVTLGVFGVRALGICLGFAGGVDFRGGVVGNVEARLGVELVELITFFKLQSEASQPAF